MVSIWIFFCLNFSEAFKEYEAMGPGRQAQGTT